MCPLGGGSASRAPVSPHFLLGGASFFSELHAAQSVRGAPRVVRRLMSMHKPASLAN